MAILERRALFLGGPAHGLVRVIDDSNRICIPIPPTISLVTDYWSTTANYPISIDYVIYNITRVQILNRIILVGYLSIEPDDDEESMLFELITSPEAKQALEPM